MLSFFWFALDLSFEIVRCFYLNKHPLSYVTASNSRYNPVELQAILIFGSDLGARFDSKLEDFAVLGRNGAQLSAISRPQICSQSKVEQSAVLVELVPLSLHFANSTRTALCSTFDCEQICGLEIAESCAPLRPKTAKSSSFESNRAPRSLPKIRIACSSTGL